MHPIKPLAAVAAASVALLASASEPSMNFWSRGQEPGQAAHRILPYRIGDEMMVVVHDPIVCGQQPSQPRFAIQGDQVVLQYDLSAPAAGVPERACVAYTIFQVKDVPKRALQVRFAGGAEPFSVSSLKRCPSQPAKADPWDCLVPGQTRTEESF